MCACMFAKYVHLIGISSMYELKSCIAYSITYSWDSKAVNRGDLMVERATETNSAVFGSNVLAFDMMGCVEENML